MNEKPNEKHWISSSLCLISFYQATAKWMDIKSLPKYWESKKKKVKPTHSVCEPKAYLLAYFSFSARRTKLDQQRAPGNVSFFISDSSFFVVVVGCCAEIGSSKAIQHWKHFWAYTCAACMQMRVMGAEHISSVGTLTLRARTSTLLAELFMQETWGLMGGSGKLQYSLSLEFPRLIINPLRA